MAAAEKLDLKKALKPLYHAKAGTPAWVDVPPLSYLMIDGIGDPESEGFAQAVEALYSLAYPLKFAYKKSEGRDWTVMPLEGLWWADDPEVFARQERDRWQWTLMILQPDFVEAGRVDECREAALKKKELPRLSQVRLETLSEGRCAQVLHVGPYAEEGETIAGLHQFIAEAGHALSGKHHEVYLSDPRRTAPEKLKTILRQPVA